MTVDLKPYPAYKDSGAPWLGSVPEQWETVPLKRVARMKSGVGFPVGRQGDIGLEVPFLRVSDMTRPGNEQWIRSVDSTVSRETVAELGAFLFPSGAVIFPKVGGALLTNKRRILSIPSCIDNNLMGCVVQGAVLMYVFALLQQLDLGRLAKPGPVPAIGEGDVEETRVPLPPPSEQSAIVRYLDYVDRRIRKYIRAKQRLIALLNEQKQAIIQRAVTRGLDPNVRLKPSGVPWLGDIPEHWKVSKIKDLARPGYKTFVDGDWIESPYITDVGVRLVQTGNIGVGRYREQGFRYVSDSTFNALNCTAIEPGDVLICRLGDPVGRACLAPDLGVRMITSVDVCILKVGDGVLNGFVVFAMSSSQYLQWVNSLVRGSTRDRVSRSMLGGFAIPLPPLPEQLAIITYLESAIATVDETIGRQQRQIDLLREYRTRLIADVVTGKLDVREAAANLPDESEMPPEPCDEEPAEDMPDLESEEESDDEQAET